MAAAADLSSLTIAALRAHAPFDELEAEELGWLGGRLTLGYHARGKEIVGPASGVAGALYIVRQGRVRGAGGAPGGPNADVILGPGECFPLGALVGRRPVIYTYRAEADTFCWQLPAADFHAFLERSPRFHAFCTDQLATLVERSHRALRAEAGATLADGAGMLAPLSSAVGRPPVSCAPQTPAREALRIMHEQRIGSIVVVDAGGAPVGIFTTVDVLGRVAAPQAAVDGPISALMTPHPVALEEKATLADAAAAMARHGIRHVVVTRDGKLAGVVSERDLFALQRRSLRRTSERIHAASDIAGLADAARDIRALAAQLLAQGVGAESLTSMVSALNDALTQRLVALVAARHALKGSWCWIALGSEGRLEQTFVTDQDNGLVFDPDADAAGARAALLAFASEVNEGLAACGFALCKGGIMARNPRWCLTLDEWRRVFAGWIDEPLPKALLHAAIFFDLRPLAGDARLAGSLREDVLARAKGNPAFLRALAEVGLETRPPLGLLGDFAADELDLKLLGVRPYVDAARVLALAAARPETGTAARLRAAGEVEAAEGFHFIQGLRLRHGNRVRTDRLGAIDQRVLKESFRQAALLQERVRMDFGL